MHTIEKFQQFLKDEQKFALKRKQEVSGRINAKPTQTKAYWIGRHDGLSHVFCESLSYQDVQYLHDFCMREIDCMGEIDNGDSAENKGFINGIRLASGYLAGVIRDIEKAKSAYKASREEMLQRVRRENPVGNRGTEIAFFNDGQITMRDHVGPSGTVWRVEPVVAFSVKHDPSFSCDKLDLMFKTNIGR